MKKYFLIFAVFLLFIVSCGTDNYSKKFSYSPEKPKAGNEIEVKYKSESNDINNSKEIEMVIYSYGKELVSTEKVSMTKIGEGWVGKYTPQEQIKGLMIKFLSSKGDDDNSELGYVIKLTDDDGNEVKGVNAGLGSLYAKYSGVLDMAAARDSVTKLFEKEFAKNPELKREYLSEYLNSIPRKQRTELARNELEKLELEENLTQRDLETLANGFKGIGDFVKSEKYAEIIKEKYPTSRLIDSKYYVRFRNMIRVDKMLGVFKEFNKVNPESDLNNYMVGGIISKLIDEKDFEQAQEMFDKYGQYVNSNIYNEAAWKLFENDTELDRATQYCEEGVKIARKELESPTGEKPVYLPESDWEDSKKLSLAMILDTYGDIKNKLGKKEDALKLFGEAVELTEKDQASINENYSSLLFEMGEYDKAKSLIEELVSEGKATEKMKSTLSEIFAKQGGSEEKFEEYVGKFEDEAKEKLITKLKEEIKNDPAPDFKLLDMEGNEVKLSDFKGKTVILDFWATWCGPCLQSFPVMQKAVEKYSENPDVKFLFINTWERVEEKKQNAEEFLQRTKYPFHVLLDDENEVVGKYGVRGIPTKFIIDGSGKIRFQSVGFSGVEAEVLLELDEMISMAK